MKTVEQGLTLEFFGVDGSKRRRFPLYLTAVAAGFPSPADDFIDKGLDLNEYCVKHPAATFFVRVFGDSMRDAGIHSGDVIVVDRAQTPVDKSVVVAAVNGELTLKRLRKRGPRLYLEPENPDFKPIEIDADVDLSIWGVVTFVVHKV